MSMAVARREKLLSAGGGRGVVQENAGRLTVSSCHIPSRSEGHTYGFNLRYGVVRPPGPKAVRQGERRDSQQPASCGSSYDIFTNAQNNVADSIIDTGNVSTQAIIRLRTVAHCRPVPLAAMVPATPDDNT
jgi:hypothetical protein